MGAVKTVTKLTLLAVTCLLLTSCETYVWTIINDKGYTLQVETPNQIVDLTPELDRDIRHILEHQVGTVTVTRPPDRNVTVWSAGPLPCSDHTRLSKYTGIEELICGQQRTVITVGPPNGLLKALWAAAEHDEALAASLQETVRVGAQIKTGNRTVIVLPATTSDTTREIVTHPDRAETWGGWWKLYVFGVFPTVTAAIWVVWWQRQPSKKEPDL